MPKGTRSKSLFGHYDPLDGTFDELFAPGGKVRPEAARTSPYAHLLTQCLGLADAPVPQVASGDCRAGDVYLLCTDGLVGMLDDPTMAELIAGHSDESRPDEAVQALLEAANEAGGHDNVTAAIVRVSGDATELGRA